MNEAYHEIERQKNMTRLEQFIESVKNAFTKHGRRVPDDLHINSPEHLGALVKITMSEYNALEIETPPCVELIRRLQSDWAWYFMPEVVGSSLNAWNARVHLMDTPTAIAHVNKMEKKALALLRPVFDDIDWKLLYEEMYSVKYVYEDLPGEPGPGRYRLVEKGITTIPHPPHGDTANLCIQIENKTLPWKPDGYTYDGGYYNVNKDEWVPAEVRSKKIEAEYTLNIEPTEMFASDVAESFNGKFTFNEIWEKAVYDSINHVLKSRNLLEDDRRLVQEELMTNQIQNDEHGWLDHQNEYIDEEWLEILFEKGIPPK